LICLYIWCL